jgi:hypothetical protein
MASVSTTLRLLWLARFGVCGFVLLTIASVGFYPGGTYRDRATVGYSFTRNFLSDLGMPRSWDGQANLAGAALFVSAEVLLACALVAFFVAFVRLSSESPRGRAWSRAAAFASIVVFAAIVVASVTPANRFQMIHVEAALLVFRASLGATACLAVAIARDGRFRTAAVVAAVLLPVALTIYVGVLEFGPSARRSDAGLMVQATAQKAVVTVLLPGIAFLSAEATRLLKGVQALSGDQTPRYPHVRRRAGAAAPR